MICLYPGAPLYDYAVKNGYIQDTVKHIEQGCPLVNVSKLTDREYYELATQTIPTLRYKWETGCFSLHIHPNVEKYCYDIVWECPHCSFENITCVEKDRIFKSVDYKCGLCGFETPNRCGIEYISLIDARLESLLTEHFCVFWGAGATWTLISQYSNAVNSNANQFIIVDSNYSKLQNGSHRIYSPDIIQQKSYIDTIICTPTLHLNIKSLIAHMYPKIRFLWINELGLIEDLRKFYELGISANYP